MVDGMNSTCIHHVLNCMKISAYWWMALMAHLYTLNYIAYESVRKCVRNRAAQTKQAKTMRNPKVAGRSMEMHSKDVMVKSR